MACCKRLSTSWGSLKAVFTTVYEQEQADHVGGLDYRFNRMETAHVFSFWICWEELHLTQIQKHQHRLQCSIGFNTSAEGNIWPFRIWCAVCMESSGLVYPNSNDFSAIWNLYLKKTDSLPSAFFMRTKLKSTMPQTKSSKWFLQKEYV